MTRHGSPSDPSAEPGEVGGRPLGSEYMVFDLVGRGAMGEVRRARTRDGAVVAVKLLRPELGSEPHLVNRFLQERAILTGLDAPNIVRVRDLVAEGTTLAIVMDLVDGPDLRRELLARGTFDAQEGAALIVGVLRGLAAVHAAGVVHRDLKPENVLLKIRPDRNGFVPQVSDFGISSVAGPVPGSRRTGAIGTPEYMAPELIDDSDPSPASDLYAVGVMLYEMLSGVTPFQAKTALAVMRKQAELLPGRPTGVPDPLWALIARLLAKDPAGRPGSASAVLIELEAMVVGLAGVPALTPLAEPPPSEGAATILRPIGDSGSGPRRRWLPVVAAAVVGLALAGAGLAITRSGSNSPTRAAIDGPVTSAPVASTPTASLGGSPTTPATDSTTDSPSASPSSSVDSAASGDTATALPDFSGQPLSDVVSRLDELGLRYVTQEVIDPTVDDNTVTKQYPAAGEPAGSRVTLTVARSAVSEYLANLGAIGAEPITDPVSIKGRNYSHPIGGPVCQDADPTWEYDLGQKYTLFQGTAGMVDDSGSRDRASIEVFADGRKIWARTVTLGHPQKIRVDVTDTLRLKIVVTSTVCVGDGIESTMAVGDAQVMALPAG